MRLSAKPNLTNYTHSRICAMGVCIRSRDWPQYRYSTLI